MTNLTWIIYLSSVCQTLQVLSIIAISFMSIGGFIWMLAVLLENTKVRSPKILYFLYGFLIFVAILTPSQSTVQMMIASEMVGRAYNSEKGQKIVDPAMDYVIGWLKEQIENQKKTK